MKLSTSFFTIILSVILFACSEGDNDTLQEEVNIPTLNTVDLANITFSSVQSGGIDIDDRGENIIEKGLCWSLNINPTIDDSKLSAGNNSEDFNLEVTELNEETTYYLRAYAINEDGVGYGNEIEFMTTVNVTAPCTPQENSMIFDSSIRNFSGASYEDTGAGLFYGNYGLRSSGTEGDLSIEFRSPPETGIYPISSDPSDMDNDECAVTGVFRLFGDFLSHRYTANSGDNAFVYVLKTDTDEYTMTFCDLSFVSGSIAFTFSGSNGNLTTTF